MLLPQMKDLDRLWKLREGDKFLYGNRMIEQLESKTTGQEVSFYQVLKIMGKNVEYIPRYEILKEDFIDGRRKKG